MKHTHHLHHSAHQDVSLLLPWYVNQTLHNAEIISVEMHLKNCLLCRIELTNLQKLSASVCQTDEIRPIALTSFAKLKERIHVTEQQALPGKQRRTAGWLSRFRHGPTLFKPDSWISEYSHFTIAAILILSFSLFLPHLLSSQQKPGNEFHTLSSTPSVSTLNNDIRIVFSDPITQKQMTQIVSSIPGQIIAGPSAHGVYQIRIEGEQITLTSVLNTISLLRKNTKVIFAEPSLSLFSPDHRKPVGLNSEAR